MAQNVWNQPRMWLLGVSWKNGHPLPPTSPQIPNMLRGLQTAKRLLSRAQRLTVRARLRGFWVVLRLTGWARLGVLRAVLSGLQTGLGSEAFGPGSVAYRLLIYRLWAAKVNRCCLVMEVNGIMLQGCLRKAWLNGIKDDMISFHFRRDDAKVNRWKGKQRKRLINRSLPGKCPLKQCVC